MERKKTLKRKRKDESASHGTGSILEVQTPPLPSMVRWHYSEGDIFNKNDILATCIAMDDSSKLSSSSLLSSDRSAADAAADAAANAVANAVANDSANAATVVHLRAPLDGTLLRQLQPHGHVVQNCEDNKLELASVKLCQHGVYKNGFCVLCGRRNLDDENCKKVILSGEDWKGTGIEISPAQEDFYHQNLTSRLRSARKLSLILDIDHTLLEANDDQPAFTMPNLVTIQFRGGFTRWIKLRPGLPEFLERASQRFEITLYTNGSRTYGQRVAQLLDPGHCLFSKSNRIISTPDDVPDLHKVDGEGKIVDQQKSLDRLFPGGIGMAVILDDRADVWHGEQRHLLQVQAYRFFKKHKTKAGSLSEDSCRQLEHSLKFLERVHEKFYDIDSKETNVANIIDQERRHVFRGCNVAFTSIFPMGTDIKETVEGKWITQLGGRVHDRIQENTTHLIGKDSSFTNKVKEAVSKGIFIVTLDWLWFSIWHIYRFSEKKCTMKNLPSTYVIPEFVVPAQSNQNSMNAGNSAANDDAGTHSKEGVNDNADSVDSDDSDLDLIAELNSAIDSRDVDSEGANSHS